MFQVCPQCLIFKYLKFKCPKFKYLKSKFFKYFNFKCSNFKFIPESDTSTSVIRKELCSTNFSLSSFRTCIGPAEITRSPCFHKTVPSPVSQSEKNSIVINGTKLSAHTFESHINLDTIRATQPLLPRIQKQIHFCIHEKYENTAATLNGCDQFWQQLMRKYWNFIMSWENTNGYTFFLVYQDVFRHVIQQLPALEYAQVKE